jgi:hypothetical protein
MPCNNREPPGGEHRALQHLASHQPERRRTHELELGNGRFAQTRHLAQELLRRVHGLGEAAKPREDRFGQGFGVAPGHGAEQDQLDQLAVWNSIGTRVAEAFS